MFFFLDFKTESPVGKFDLEYVYGKEIISFKNSTCVSNLSFTKENFLHSNIKLKQVIYEIQVY